MSGKVGNPARPKVDQKSPEAGLRPPPGKQKLKSKRARIERQKARAISLNNSSEWFGVPRDSPPGLTLEDRFESVTSLSDSKKAQVRRPSSTFTGFRELRVKDMLVILGLWFVRLFIPWVEAWHEFNLHLLVEPSHWAALEKYFAYHEIVVFVAKCLLCLTISITVDFINFKYPTYLIILLLYIFAPIVGVAIIILLVARGYDRAYYFEWWHKTVVMMMWAMSVPFITFPVQFSCIFNQEKNMSRLAHYNWTAIFVFIETVNASIAYWIIPPYCPSGYFTLFAAWCAIGVLNLVLDIEVLSLMRWAKPQIVSLNTSTCKKKNATSELYGSAMRTNYKREPGESGVVTKPNANGPPRDLKMKKLLWFLPMLATVIFTSVVFGILKRTRPEEDWDKHDSVTGTSMLVGGQFLGVLLVVPVLFVIRKWMKKLHRTRVLSPDVLALGFPLIINTVALAVILTRFLVLSSLNEGDVILGPIPSNEVSAIEFYNVEFRNRSICVNSEYFSPLRVPPRQRATRVLKEPGEATITFSVTLDPRTNPPIRTHGNFTYKKGVWVTYIVTLAETHLGSTDIEAFYSELLLIRVNGTDDIRPKKEPLIVFINTYVVFIDGWYYNVTASGKTETISQNYKGIAMPQSYPPGKLTITYWTEWIKLVQRGSHPPVTIQLSVENYCVYTVLLCLSNVMKDPSNYSELVPRMLQTHKTMQIAGPNSNMLPAKKELEKDLSMVIGMTLAGMAQSGVYIGYIYLFWLDFPLSGYRTTFLAGFWILMAVPAELATIKVTDIGLKEATLLFVLQILFTVLHFGTASFLYTSKFNFRARPN